MPRPTATFRAYLAALFDSRGHVSVSRKGYAKLRIAVPRRAMVTLAREVYGGSIYRTKWRDKGANWQWDVAAFETVARVVDDLYPYSRQNVALSVMQQYLKGRIDKVVARQILQEYYHQNWYNPRLED